MTLHEAISSKKKRKKRYKHSFLRCIKKSAREKARNLKGVFGYRKGVWGAWKWFSDSHDGLGLLHYLRRKLHDQKKNWLPQHFPSRHVFAPLVADWLETHTWAENFPCETATESRSSAEEHCGPNIWRKTTIYKRTMPIIPKLHNCRICHRYQQITIQ